jgi:glyoxylase-like metal-dependent hydrolase (beta-lactamase superfamily II)
MTQGALARVKTIRSGISNIHIIESHGSVVVVDAGSCSMGHRRLARALRRLGHHPSSVRLLVLTHVHYDHVKAAAAMAELCECPVAVHAAEAPRLAAGLMVVPPGVFGWARVASRLAHTPLGRFLLPKIMGHRPLQAEVVVQDTLRLEPYGLAGSLVSTPGHSPGSISLVLDSGQAMVGDLVFNAYPFGLSPILPPFAHDLPGLLRSWRRLLDSGVSLIYPGHGRALTAEILERAWRKHAPATGNNCRPLKG